MKIYNLFTFSRKQQQKLIIWCGQYHIRNQHIQLSKYNRENHVFTEILFVYFLVVNNNKN